MKQNIASAGYFYLYYNHDTKSHVLLNLDNLQMEVFFANKNHASWGLIYKNTHLEFAHSLPINRA